MKLKKKQLILALILSAGLMSALNAKEVDNNANQNTVAPVILPLDVPPTITSEAPQEPSAALEIDSMQEVPFEEFFPAQAVESPEEGLLDSVGTEQFEGEDVVEDPSIFDNIRNFLGSYWDSAKSRSEVIVRKMEYKHKYGDDADADPNYSVILEAHEAVAQADERRRQRELDTIVLQQEADRLYEESRRCLALNGFHESRSETADQEVASAAVVLNRLSVGHMGATTICEVIYTPKQFSWVEQHGTHLPNTTNPIERKAWQRSLLIAERMLDPDATFIDPSNGAIYYYNPSIVDWKYKKYYKQTAVLGNHRFMSNPDTNHRDYIDNSIVRINPVLFNGLSHEERNKLKDEYQKKGE